MMLFDIGGTWFRSGRIDAAGQLTAVSRRPASSFRSHPGVPIAQLQADVITFISDRVTADLPENRSIAISFGGVVDQRTGQILNAAPLWGSGTHPLDLVARLEQALPGHDVRVYNDVSAAAAAYAAANPGVRRLGVFLVSTGCAFRAISGRSLPDIGIGHGLHGEVGHLRHELFWDGRPMHETCDCGGINHLNAFSSGRAIHALWQHATGGKGMVKPLDFEAFLAEGDPLARSVLRCVIRPVASTILQIFTLDAALEQIVLAGGVIDWLGHLYVDELMSQLESAGLYEVTTRYPDFFASRITMGQLGDEGCMLGAYHLAAAGAPGGAASGGKP